MILITKSTGIPELDKLKEQKKSLSDHAAYKALDEDRHLKKQVQENLMQEQGSLCAYCTRRLPDMRSRETDPTDSGIHIEHWIARAGKDQHQTGMALEYRNLLAVCTGNQAQRRKGWHTCDAKRGHAPLKANPLDPATIETIYYDPTGTIHSNNADIEFDLTNRLNLNLCAGGVDMPGNRQKVWDDIKRRIAEGDITPDVYNRYLAFLEAPSASKIPFCGYAIYQLKKAIRELVHKQQDEI